MKEKTAGQKLAEELLYKPEHGLDKKPDELKDAMLFCEGYKQFLDEGKTEREAVIAVVSRLQKAGYKEFEHGKEYAAGEKVYVVNRGKAVMAATIGKKSLAEGVRIAVAHLDSPRIDLKQNPLYQAEEMAYFKTHYYGGIRKYQWVGIPLTMHGLVVKADGSTVTITLGESEGEPVFTITDLLPHLSAEQNKRALSEGIKGEELNILIGSLPFEDKEMAGRVKLETMRLLNEKFGITEKDFTRAEIEFVPAFKAKDIGFDGSMIGAYGQDDRVCAYTSLLAEIEIEQPENTTVCVLCDKEETGSDGNTGLAGDYVFHFLEDLADMQKVNYRRLVENSLCLSADVNAAYDPTFPEPFEKQNSCMLNKGVVVTKYTGSRGKGGTSDASAELMGYVANLFDKHAVTWQTGELGKVDAGGGGTVAKFVANRNIEVVDVGVPVLSMHSPFEVTSKLDVYNTYLGFKVFAQDGTRKPL